VIWYAQSATAMQDLGRQAAESARCGSAWGLVGGLGAGKTHWVKGLVAGLGSASDVTSPTFGLIHEYPDGRLPVIHADFYRLDAPAELISIGWEEYLEQPGVIVAEWADQFPEHMPENTVWLFFQVEADGSRKIRIGDRPGLG
jgi:tRNA threonylcarbamoyladenosine biosynthesis protein TsaE